MDHSCGADNDSDNGGGSLPYWEAQPLCARGCGFYGTAENRGLCSKCFIDNLKDCMVEDSRRSTTMPLTETSAPTLTTTTATTRLRCFVCRRKVGVLGFSCRLCGRENLCGAHMHSEAHACEFDFKNAGKIEIAGQNPVCKGEKLEFRL